MGRSIRGSSPKQNVEAGDIGRFKIWPLTVIKAAAGVLNPASLPSAVSVALHKTPKCLQVMVPLVGIELTTYRLQSGCSTN